MISQRGQGKQNIGNLGNRTDCHSDPGFDLQRRAFPVGGKAGIRMFVVQLYEELARRQHLCNISRIALSHTEEHFAEETTDNTRQRDNFPVP